MGWGAAARLGLFLLRNKRARNYLIAAVFGVLLLASFALILLVSSVGAMFSVCKQTSTQLISSASTPSFASSEPSEAALSDIPGNYLKVYRQTGQEAGVDWTILAAVGKQESDHGRASTNCATSSTGARGPMQFQPSTWASEGVDGNGDGKRDPCNFEDAIPATAGYLKDLGAPDDYRGALCSYYGMCADEHADYANEVLAQAEEYRKAASQSGSSGGDSAQQPGSSTALLPPLMSAAHAQEPAQSESGGSASPQVAPPVPEQYMDGYKNDWGKPTPEFAGGFHDGTDIPAPRGTPIYAMVDGTVRENPENNSDHYDDIGGYNVVIEATESVGPVKKGDRLQYAHMDGQPTVEPGDEVRAGEMLGEIGDTGYGPQVTRGEFEPNLHVGWYDASGERAQHNTGAMNPYPLLQWVEENQGSATGGGSEEDSGGSITTSAPTSTTSATSNGDLPPFCTPFRVAGLIQDVGQALRGLGGGGTASGEVGGGPQKGQDLVRAAQKYLGTSYVIGDLSPQSCNPQSIDCDCLIYLSSKDIGLPGTENLTGDPQQHRTLGRPVEGGDLKAGDIIVYEQAGMLANVPGGHVAIATGNGNEVIHAIPPQTTYSPDYRTQGSVVAIRRIV